jgi:EAL and modified HD-GYP domain-containing signal transduction protein
MDQIFIGRQPIFDADRNVVAYELLFRSGQRNTATVVDGDQATAQTLVNGIMDFGLDQVVGNKLAFVNLTRNFLLNQDRLPALQGRLVLEVLEDITPDPPIIDALKELVRRGYTVALDDFTYREELRPLIAIAQIIKLELPQIGLDALPSHVERLRKFNCRLLAEKIETYEEFERCKALGIQYFQGYFLSRPETLSNKRLPANKLAVLQILAKVQDPDATLDELEKLVGADVALSYRILRFANSAQFAVSTKVDTVRRAIVMTGLQQIRTWVSLIVLARLDDKPPELLRIAIQRARLCELLARDLDRKPPESYATAGLFSTLEALLDRPIDEVLASLPLNDDLVAALRDQSGPIGEVLRMVLDGERGDWSACARLGIDTARISALYLSAIEWTEQSTLLMNPRA